jgi:hypothetical protein
MQNVFRLLPINGHCMKKTSAKLIHKNKTWKKEYVKCADPGGHFIHFSPNKPV